MVGVARKLAKHAAIIYHIRNLVTPNSLSIFYKCFVYSNMIYLDSKQIAFKPLVLTQKNIIIAMSGISQIYHTAQMF